MTPSSQYVEELARRIATAAISMEFGLSSLDYTLKTYVQGKIGPGWIRLAQLIVDASTEQRSV